MFDHSVLDPDFRLSTTGFGDCLPPAQPEPPAPCWLPHERLRLLSVPLHDPVGPHPCLVAELDPETEAALQAGVMSVRAAFLHSERVYLLPDSLAQPYELYLLQTLPEPWLPEESVAPPAGRAQGEHLG